MYKYITFVVILFFVACKKYEITELTDEWVRFMGPCTGFGAATGNSLAPVMALRAPGSTETMILNQFTQDGEEHILLLRTDSSGFAIFDKQLSGNIYTQVRGMRHTPDGNYMLLSNLVSTASEVDDTTQTQFIEIDGNADTVGTSYFKKDAAFNYFISDFMYTADGKMLVVGTTTKIDTNKNGWSESFAAIDRSDIYVAQLEKSGNTWVVDWERIIGYLYRDYATVIDTMSNGNLLIGAVTNEGNPDGENAVVLQLYSFGAVLQQHSTDDHADANVLDIAAINDTDWLHIIYYSDLITGARYEIHKMENGVAADDYRLSADDGIINSLYINSLGNALAAGQLNDRAVLWSLPIGQSGLVSDTTNFGVLDAEKYVSEAIQVLDYPLDGDYIYVLGTQNRNAQITEECSNLMLLRVRNPL